MRGILVLLVIVVLVAIAAVATGFVDLHGNAGRMPQVSGGQLPSVDADVGKVTLGTRTTTVDVPKVETEKKAVKVPTLGVEKPDGK